MPASRTGPSPWGRSRPRRPAASARILAPSWPGPGAIGLEAGDTQSLVLRGPDGRVLAEADDPALVRPRAQSLLFGGRKRPPGGWPPGTYTASFTVRRAGAVALERSFSLELPGVRP